MERMEGRCEGRCEGSNRVLCRKNLVSIMWQIKKTPTSFTAANQTDVSLQCDGRYIYTPSDPMDLMEIRLGEER